MATTPTPQSFSRRIARAGMGLRSASALVGGAARRAGLGRAARSAPLALIFVTAATLTAEAKRVALVVGNAAYDNVYALKNATNDAQDLAASLERLDFEVTLLTDATEADFWTRLDTFAAECAQGAALGMDGKTLIHPAQIEACNHAFSPSAEALAHAQAVVELFARPENADRGAVQLDGVMVERLHLPGAEQMLARGRAFGLI